MGQSTDAIIAFGFDLGEELPESLQDLMEEHESEIDVVLATDAGVELPSYESGCDYSAYSAAHDSALAGIKISLIEHCSGEYPMYFLAARGSNKRAHRGHPTSVSPEDLNGRRFDECVAQMKLFCERHDIEWQEPEWHIFSMWN